MSHAPDCRTPVLPPHAELRAIQLIILLAILATVVKAIV